ncbi:hypothetical protein Q9233_003163 [Columba guinea]|nr:hypothetical protein Q9233_003163 [Columba guinea]
MGWEFAPHRSSNTFFLLLTVAKVSLDLNTPPVELLVPKELFCDFRQISTMQNNYLEKNEVGVYDLMALRIVKVFAHV